MPNRTSAAPAAAPARAPVVFLNPNVLAPMTRVGPIGDDARRGVTPGITSLRDTPMEALMTLLDTASATLVCTDDLVTGHDVRDHLIGRGLRGPRFGADWITARERAARGQAVETWLVRYGRPPAIVIDYPPAVESSIVVGQGAVIVSVAVPCGAELTAAACREALAALRQRAA